MTRNTQVAVGAGVLMALGVAALVPGLRLPLLVVLVVAAAAAPRGSSLLWAAAAGLPVAVILAWGEVAGSALLDGTAGCANVLSPTAWGRALEALLVTGTVVLLARRLAVPLGSLALRRPSRVEVTLAVLAVVVIPVPSLYLGVVLAEPFFGRIDLELSMPLALLPALTLAVANGTMEELAYRGALMSWSSRVLGPAAALVGQAAIFGLAHAGTDYVEPIAAVPVILVIAAGGLVAGLVVRLTGSLWLPIVVHICFDLPLYYAVACRVNGG